MFEHSKKALADWLTHDVISVALSSLSLVLLAELAEHLCFDLAIPFLFVRDVVYCLFRREVVEFLVEAYGLLALGALVD
jgi:hypothetical protein